MCLVDGDFLVLEANAAFKTNFAQRKDVIIGLSTADVFERDLFEKHLRPEIERCPGGSERHRQMWIDFPDQEQRFADIAYFPYLETDNAIVV